MNWIPTDEIKDRLGVPDEAIREFQRRLVFGTDFKKTGRVFLWSESSYEALAASLGVKLPEDASPQKNTPPAASGEAGGPVTRSWWVLDSWPGGMWLRAAEKGTRPRDIRETVRVRGIPRRGFAVGTEVRCTHLHDDLWAFVEVVRPEKDRVRSPGQEGQL
jgi:hypothetical protein